MTGLDPEAALAAVRVPGTTANLGPGFDALGLALGRHLVAVAVPRVDAVVTTDGEGADDVPTDETNLVWTSLVAFCEEHEVDVPDVSLRVRNDLPLERGLGSSSAAIVAGLALGRALTEAPVGDLHLVRLADRIEGHPDNVAPAVLGGFVACTTTTGGDLVVRRAQPDPRIAVLTAVPDNRQNTHAARGVLPEELSRTDAATQAARAVHVAGGLAGTWPVAADAVEDRLHEPPRLQVMTASSEVLAGWREAGLQAWLSGAGPTVAALVRRADAEQQEAAMALARRAGFDPRVLPVDLAGAVACTADRCAIAGPDGCADCPRQALC